MILADWLSWYKDSVLLLAISIVFSLDQITKAVVRHRLLLGESIPTGGHFHITHTFNTGSAFGLFPDQTLFLILASLIGIAVLFIVYRNQPVPSFPLRISLGMQLGGALGNLVDRVRMGQVTDFIEVGFWPVFNLADASIVIGIVILTYLILFAAKEADHPTAGVGSGYAKIGDSRSVPFAASISRPERLEEERISDDVLAQTLNRADPCPICSSTLVTSPGGRRCPSCGAREWVEKLE